MILMKTKMMVLALVQPRDTVLLSLVLLLLHLHALLQDPIPSQGPVLVLDHLLVTRNATVRPTLLHLHRTGRGLQEMKETAGTKTVKETTRKTIVIEGTLTPRETTVGTNLVLLIVIVTEIMEETRTETETEIPKRKTKTVTRTVTRTETETKPEQGTLTVIEPRTVTMVETLVVTRTRTETKAKTLVAIEIETEILLVLLLLQTKTETKTAKRTTKTSLDPTTALLVVDHFIPSPPPSLLPLHFFPPNITPKIKTLHLSSLFIFNNFFFILQNTRQKKGGRENSKQQTTRWKRRVST